MVLKNYGAWRKTEKYYSAFLKNIIFHCLWQLSFLLGGRKRREGGRGIERTYSHMPCHLIQQPLTEKWEGWRGVPTKYANGEQMWKEEFLWGCSGGLGMSKATWTHPSRALTPIPRAFWQMGLLSTRESTGKGRGTDPGRGRSFG